MPHVRQWPDFVAANGVITAARGTIYARMTLAGPAVARAVLPDGIARAMHRAVSRWIRINTQVPGYATARPKAVARWLNLLRPATSLAGAALAGAAIRLVAYEQNRTLL